MQPKLGIIAGGGDLPAVLIQACRTTQRPCHVLALEGHADRAVIDPSVTQDWVRLGAAGRALELLHGAQVQEVVFAGHVQRPTLRELRPDLRATRFLAKGLLNGGDDKLLTSIVRELEEREGLRVIGPDDVLDGLLGPEGTLTRNGPSAEDWQDIERGREVVRILGAADVGQAVVVQQGIILGVEAAEGTDGLIRRCAALQHEGRRSILVKLSKPEQEKRVDLPTIGLNTVRECSTAGLSGIVFEAGATLLLGQGQMIEAADESDLFLQGISLGNS